MGKSLEVIKDLGNAKTVCDRYNLGDLVGTHAIGHARMATESGVDIKSAHPFWGYPFSDVSVVHNGQLTNYWNNRMAKDTMAAKPLVLYESDDLVAMGSEEIAIRSVLPQEIDTYDPFDGEVKVWQI